jgi:hypothetical protein
MFPNLGLLKTWMFVMSLILLFRGIKLALPLVVSLSSNCFQTWDADLVRFIVSKNRLVLAEGQIVPKGVLEAVLKKLKNQNRFLIANLNPFKSLFIFSLR